MRWMVTGGCGYIGSNVVKLLHDRGDEVVVLDDLSTGSQDRVGDAKLVHGPITDRAKVDEALAGADGVIHFAGRKKVGESVEQPLWYYRENVYGMQVLLEAMTDAGVSKIVYSSSATVYGTPARTPVTEDSVLVPENPYGETKVVGEWMLRASTHLRWIALRYFNVAGAGPNGELADKYIYNLIPLVFAALTSGKQPQLYGDDWPTPDGTCIRDYVHILDLAEAHLAAADALDSDVACRAYNVGCGRGFSVLEVMDAVRRITGIDFEPEIVERRPGDAAETVASVDAVAANLGWRAKRLALDEIVESAWKGFNASST